MSVHADREEKQLLSRLQHVLNIGIIHTQNTRDISMGRTRQSWAPRTMDDFRSAQEVPMGRTHFELSRSAEASLRAAMVSSQPLVIRSALTSGDMVALIDEWDLFMAQDKSLYQMGEGRGGSGCKHRGQT